MNQPSNTSLQDLAAAARDSATESPTVPKLFQCAIPGCEKVFRRKEHLTRHLKSHDTELRYMCHICGRRYARSDVLRRHVEFHPQYYKSKRNFVACTRCRESKTKCDDDTPCGYCRRRALPCVRTNTSTVDVSTDSMALEPTSDHSSSPQSPTQAPGVPGLREYVDSNRATIARRLSVYFTGIHPTWPILQPSTVTPRESPGLLLASIIMLASWLEGDLEHLTLFPLVFDEIVKKQGPNPSLPIKQAMVLCILYSTFCLTTEGMALKALKVHNILVAACRFSGIIAPQRGILYASVYVPSGGKHEEAHHRLAFALLRLDAYLSALIDFPPLIRYQELSMPLSQTTCWINVATEDERRKLLDAEPPMRKKTSFSFRVHDLFGAPRGNALASPWTKMDYHFILCAIQSGAWEGGHHALRTVPDDIHSRTHCHDIRSMWREYLTTWMSGLENDCQVSVMLRWDYFIKPRGDDMAPQTLLLWHMTSLKLQAPPDLWGLQGCYYKLRPAGTSPNQKSGPHPSIRPWQVSKVARVAVWHSAQISRIVSTELGLENPAMRLRLNPLLMPALLMAAIVTLGYTYYTRVCPRCTGCGTIDLVNIFSAPKECERLGPWLEEGVGLTNWGINVFTGLPVCQCSVIRMSKWFRELLARDELADAALVLFLNELKAGLW